MSEQTHTPEIDKASLLQSIEAVKATYHDKSETYDSDLIRAESEKLNVSWTFLYRLAEIYRCSIRDGYAFQLENAITLASLDNSRWKRIKERALDHGKSPFASKKATTPKPQPSKETLKETPKPKAQPPKVNRVAKEIVINHPVKSCSRLNAKHREHLLREGFTDEQIDQWVKEGLRSLSESEARDRGIGCEGDSGKFESSSGLWFPCVGEFGQLRCDNPPIRKGKPAKYLSPCKTEVKAHIPDDCKAVTEGAKDGRAGTLHGEENIGWMAGVPHYRKTLPKNSGLTLIFDSDGWINPSVFTNLFNAGMWTNGKIQLVPEIDGQPKAGLCEYFKAGYTADDFKSLLDSAMEPLQFLYTLPEHWDGLEREKLQDCIKAAGTLLFLHEPKSRNVDDFLGRFFKDKELEDLRNSILVVVQRKIERLQFERGFKRLAAFKGEYFWMAVFSNQPLYDHLKLTAKFGDRFKFNILKQQVELDEERFKLTGAKARLAIDHNFQPVLKSREDFLDVFLLFAQENSYDPILDYLESVHQKYGDDTSILKDIAFRHFGQSDPIADTLTIKWLIGAAARIYQPGCKMDNALILRGEQGRLKSAWFKKMAGGDEFFTDGLGDITNKDNLMKMHLYWLCEWAEMETVFRRKEMSAVKEFLTQSQDSFRKPYGRDVEQHPRRSVICGTTNEDEFLSDTTGNRRFWVIEVLKKIDLTMVEGERDRIWAAIVSLYKSGHQWHLTDDEEKAASELSERFQTKDPWLSAIEEHCSQTRFTTIDIILSKVLGIEIGKQSSLDKKRVKEVLAQLGWIKDRNRVNGKQCRGYCAPQLPKESDNTDPWGVEPDQPIIEVSSESPVTPDQDVAETSKTKPATEQPKIAKTALDDPPLPNDWTPKQGDRVLARSFSSWKHATVLEVPGSKLSWKVKLDGLPAPVLLQKSDMRPFRVEVAA